MLRAILIAVSLLVAADLSWARHLPRRSEGGSAKAAATEHYQGIVLLVADDRLTLMTGSNSQQFTVSRDTLVLVNGRGGQMRDVRPGYLANVAAEKNNGQHQAKFIEAFLPK